jgi:hypothetical protein
MEKEKGRNDKKKKMKRLRSYHRNCQQWSKFLQHKVNSKFSRYQVPNLLQCQNMAFTT